MRKLSILFILFAFSFNSFSQEICDNAIDDDADGLIDLNDDDCDCDALGAEITDLIPNSSFEERTCCPIGFSQLYCVDDWNQASEATSDYFNVCDFDAYPGGAPMMPLPGEPGGEGWAGFIAEGGGAYEEYIGTEDLESPLLAGTSYTLKLWTAWSSGGLELELSLFGTPNEADLPWTGWLCPEEVGDWELLNSDVVTYTEDHAWQEISFTFVPSVDMNAIAIGPPCNPDVAGYNYYYIDELSLFESSRAIEFSETGDLCDDDLELTVSIDTIGGTWQWYKDGIALLGETGEIIDLDAYGFGNYSAVYSLGGDCFRRNYNVDDSESVVADFDFFLTCFGQTTHFLNTSFYGAGVTPTWHWDFGDGETSTWQHPNHFYSIPGTYTVELIVFNDLGCNDTIEFEVFIDFPINADFDFEVTGYDVDFTNTTTYDGDSDITWHWDFDDDTESILENPSHTYPDLGVYSVELIAISEYGCGDTIVKDVPIVTFITASFDEVFTDGELLNIYPNPTTNNITIETAGTYNYQLSALNGDIVLEGTGTDQELVFLESIAAGTYFLRVENGRGSEVIKLVKQGKE